MAFSQDVIDRVWKRQEGRCAACDKKLVRKNRGKQGRGGWEAHHQRPVSHGGSDSLSNCAILCLGHHLKAGHGGNFKKRVSGGEKHLKARNRSLYTELGKALKGLHWKW